jgi:hypothetical protein
MEDPLRCKRSKQAKRDSKRYEKNRTKRGLKE